MNNKIDCLFIGHNEMQFVEYEKRIRSMGINSASYRDLNLNFIKYHNKPYSTLDFLNMLLYNKSHSAEWDEPFNLGNLFSPAIAYLATYLNRRGFTFDYVNSFQEEKAELAEKLKQNNIVSIAIITTLYVSVLPILEIISFIKQYNTTARIIIGGPFVATQLRNSNNEEELQYFFKSLDADFYVNSSEGEATLVKLLTALKHNLPFEEIPNISYRSDNAYLTTPIEAENNLLAENIVDWKLFVKKIHQFAAIRTTISCPFRCSFCGFPQHAGKYQTVDVEIIEKELNAIAELGTVTSLNFIDDTFNIPTERFKDILRMIIKNKYNFKWNSHFRCQFADRETVELMKESGCEGVFLGIESGNQQILEHMNKAATIDKYKGGLALLNEYEIITYASFIIGFPGETEKSVQDTVRFIEENQPTFFRTQLWYCDPITPIYQKREKYQITGSQFEWSHATMNSETACDLIDEIFLSIQNSIFVPQYNFDFTGIFNLLHRGMSLEQIKSFLTYFNQGIKERLMDPNQDEVSSEVISKCENLFAQKTEVPLIDKYQAEFDF